MSAYIELTEEQCSAILAAGKKSDGRFNLNTPVEVFREIDEWGGFEEDGDESGTLAYLTSGGKVVAKLLFDAKKQKVQIEKLKAANSELQAKWKKLASERKFDAVTGDAQRKGDAADLAECYAERNALEVERDALRLRVEEFEK